jgi:hypothetical protein
MTQSGDCRCAVLVSVWTGHAKLLAFRPSSITQHGIYAVDELSQIFASCGSQSYCTCLNWADRPSQQFGASEQPSPSEQITASSEINSSSLVRSVNLAASSQKDSSQLIRSLNLAALSQKDSSELVRTVSGGVSIHLHHTNPFNPSQRGQSTAISLSKRMMTTNWAAPSDLPVSHVACPSAVLSTSSCFRLSATFSATPLASTLVIISCGGIHYP